MDPILDMLLGVVAKAGPSGLLAIALYFVRRDLKDERKALDAERAARKTDQDAADARHEALRLAAEAKHEALRVECAAELRSLHGAHAESIRSFGAEMREELCPACRSRDTDHRRLT